MNLITIDFETYYDKNYNLKKMTMEEYIRDPRFEVVGVGIKVNNEETEWASGTHRQLKDYLDGFDWENSMVLAHNTMFDAAILSWQFDIDSTRISKLTDTLCIGRARHYNAKSLSLSALVERYGLGAKGTEVHDALGKGRLDFTEEELDSYGDYCVNDVELTFALFKKMVKDFPVDELRLIDITLRMFTDAQLELDLDGLENHLSDIRQRKEEYLIKTGVTKAGLMSNLKFAKALLDLGVEPPKKISPTTGKETLALAKTDEGFKDLANHSCEKVRALVEARLEVKGTLEETRTERFIGIAKRGSLPVPIRYYAAHTGRWGGDDKINLQNLPSRGSNKLKDCITAPEGFTLIDCDSSQIEARVLAWLAGQEDLVSAFQKKEDVYVKMASTIYDVPESAVTKEQRFVGKTTILGAGYGMGALRFKDQLMSFGFDMDEAEAKRVIGIYRETNASIFRLWQAANEAIRQLAGGWKNSGCFGTDNLLHYGYLDCNGKHQDPVACVVLPSGLPIMYDDLDGDVHGQNFDYKSRNGRTRLYGGKLVENVCQALARIIIGDQIIRVSKVYPVNLTVHDSIICCIPDEEVSDAVEYIESVMRIGPDWAKGIPLDCESGIGKTYGSCG